MTKGRGNAGFFRLALITIGAYVTISAVFVSVAIIAAVFVVEFLKAIYG